jgi:hypothetical protein
MVDFRLLASKEKEWKDRKSKIDCHCENRTSSFCYWTRTVEPLQELPDDNKRCECDCHKE